MNLSPRAQKAQEEAAARALIYREQRVWMRAGPHLHGDTIVVPSAWYKAEAAAFWGSHGFRYHRDRATWERDTYRLHDGKRYTAQAWLQSTRRKFYEFWPTLLPPELTCLLCCETFQSSDEHRIYCPTCEAQAQAERKFHDQNQ